MRESRMTKSDEDDERIGEILTDLSPTSWAEAQRRLSVVRRYSRSLSRSAASAAQSAKELGISRSLFYRLVRTYEKRLPTNASTHRSAVNPEINELIVQAIDEAGDDASPARILRRATEMCEAVGLPGPSQQAVRTRFHRLLAGRKSRGRFRVAAGQVLDRSYLNATVTAAGAATPVVLTCVIDLDHGIVVDHLLSAEQPRMSEVADLACRAVNPADPVGISVSDHLLHGAELVKLIQDRGRRVVMGRWRAGATIRSVTGLRIGRIQLLERLPTSGLGPAPVDLAIVRRVVAELLDRASRD